MAAPPIGGSSRYIPEGVTRFYFVVTIANYLAPSRGELNAGTDLTPEVANAGNWGITSNAVDAPDLATTFTAQIPGKVSVDGSTLDMYASSTSADVRTLLPRNTVGYVVKFPEGDITGQRMDTFPVKVGSQAKPTAFGNPSVISLVFYVTRNPGENLVIP